MRIEKTLLKLKTLHARLGLGGAEEVINKKRRLRGFTLTVWRYIVNFKLRLHKLGDSDARSELSHLG